MENLLKANANLINGYIVEHLSKEVSFTFDKNELTILIENLNDKGLKMIVKMHKNALDQKSNETISWQYLADPKDKNSTVNRKCQIFEFGNNLSEIVEKKRFDKDYLKELENPAQ